MIVSQVMMAGLLVQWLRTQWQDEKESFQKEINQQFKECVNQVIDSMLIKHLIVPVLNDSSVNEDHIFFKFNKRIHPGDKKLNQRVTAIYNNNGGNNQAVLTISMPDSGKAAQKEDITFSSYDSAEKKILLRSVKLIIRQTEDSTGKWSQFNHLISTVPDTSLLKKLFENKLGRNGDKYDIRWISDSFRNRSDNKGSVLYLRNDLFEMPFYAEVMHFNKFIVKGIFAQILFALVLILFTGAAFFFTYRSLIKQEALNKIRNDFISNISHELKTPVSTVSVALEALKNFDRMKDTVKSDEYLDIAFNEMKRLDQLISQVLNTSILEDQNQFLNPEETDLVSLINDILRSMQVRFSQAGAKVEFNPEPEVSLLNLDKLHIQGVLINLLDNSLKYCTINPTIKITVEEKPLTVLLTIRDNGPGIPEEYISRVFEKFFRVPKGDVHNVKGYGLGLSYAKLVMKHHSGKIIVNNNKEGGCEFTLTFPVLHR
jgi:signal transduction histidine kinase